MGLLQKAVETFDAHQSLVGKTKVGHQPLAPIGHTIASADLEITLNEAGELIGITVPEQTEKIIIPVTEDSAGRTRASCAHPLCDQVDYLSGAAKEKFSLYCKQLQVWADSVYSHPMLQPILTYVQKKTLLQDLQEYGIKKVSGKDLVRWRVIGIGPNSGPCWTNSTLFQAYSAWYEATRNNDPSLHNPVLCMVTGALQSPAKQHLKGIISSNGNAKLITSNDKTNFTYRGRFTEERQSATVSYIASQKAHNALRWLAAEQGSRVVFGGRTFLCWNPQGKQVPHSNFPFLSHVQPAPVSPTDYHRELQRTLSGLRSELPEQAGGVVIAAFDAATTGRLALTYYRELRGSDFLQRLHDWDEFCCWWTWNPDTRKYNAIRSPSLLTIVNCAFGTQKEQKNLVKLTADDKVTRQQIQRLISCRIDGARFPDDILRTLVNRASSPQSYEPVVYQTLLFVTCAVIRKYRYERTKEELSMQLNYEETDRSYLFGRLLAVMELAERSAYRKDETREPNAIRLQSVFRRRPLHTANIIESQLEQAYLPRLSIGSRIYYKNLMGEILEKLTTSSSTALNQPLDDLYLIGYYLQRAELYKSKDQKEQEET